MLTSVSQDPSRSSHLNVKPHPQTQSAHWSSNRRPMRTPSPKKHGKHTNHLTLSKPRSLFLRKKGDRFPRISRHRRTVCFLPAESTPQKTFPSPATELRTSGAPNTQPRWTHSTHFMGRLIRPPVARHAIPSKADIWAELHPTVCYMIVCWSVC